MIKEFVNLASQELLTVSNAISLKENQFNVYNV